MIEKMRLDLPHGFEDRAEHIGRLVVHHLAGMPVQENAHLARLSLPPVRIDPASTDDQVARRVALAIHGQIAKSEK